MTRTFRDLGVAENLAARLEELGIVEPATVQSLTFPIALEGADVIGLDRPESTTLAFALPLLQRLQPSGAGLQGLVIAPTRGRCVRVAKELTELAQPVRTALLAVYGGIPLGPQEQALDGARVDLVVGTPGRLLDHLQHGSLDLRDVKLVVIDEAAQLLDLGFTPDVDELVAHCPAERQTLLFAATLPDEVAALARRWLTHPVIVRADADHLRVASEAAQDFFLVHRLDKPRVLARILQAPDVRRAAVFVRTTRGVDRLVEELRSVGVDAIASPVVLDRSQPAASFDRFLGGESEVLVATEASARRIELRGVSHVINYDCPADETVYLHRIGRAARTVGTVITLVGFHEAERLHMIRTAGHGTGTVGAGVFHLRALDRTVRPASDHTLGPSRQPCPCSRTARRQEREQRHGRGRWCGDPAPATLRIRQRPPAGAAAASSPAPRAAIHQRPPGG